MASSSKKNNSGPGDASPLNFVAAGKAVEKLTRAYPAIAHRNLAAARAEFARLGARPDGVEALRYYAHNVTGQGASFDYPLMSEIGASLEEYLLSLDADSEPQACIVEAHFEAFQHVLDNRMSGDFGAEGDAFVMRLRETIANAKD